MDKRIGIAMALLLAGCGVSGLDGTILERLPDGGVLVIHEPDDAGAEETPDAGEPDAGPVWDAGTTDGGRDFSSDRSKFFGPSRCAGSGLQLCEDFESGQVDPGTWTVVGIPPVIDGMEHARGAKALHIKFQDDAHFMKSYITERKTFPATNNTYWGRMFVFFKSLPTVQTYSHWTLASASQQGAEGALNVSGQTSNGVDRFTVGTNNTSPGGTGDWTVADTDRTPVPLGQWVCLEWLHDGKTNDAKFFWDAVEHPGLEISEHHHRGNNNPLIFPQFTDLWIGFEEYQPTGEVLELWIDEIAVDKSRIGCIQ